MRGLSWYRANLAEVRRSYTPEKRWAELQGDLPSALIYRPVSIWLTPFFLLLGVPPNAVSVLGLLAALSMPLVAWWGGQHAYVAVALLAIGNHVLDCVDGNVARTTRRISGGAGALLDDFLNPVFWSLYFLSIGILVRRASSSPVGQHGVEIALGLMILVLVHRHLRDSYELRFGERAEFTARPPATYSAWTIVRMCLAGLEGVYAFALLAAGALGVWDHLLIAIAVYVVVIFVSAVVLTFRRAVQKGSEGSRS